MRFKFLLGPLPDAGASVFVTAIFLIFFVILCWYVFRRDRRPIYRHLETLPLSEDDL